jgi:homoserine dehydrogenase
MVYDNAGLDVARKVVILARECGLEVELEDMAVQSLVPEQLSGPDVGVEAFMQQLPQVRVGGPRLASGIGNGLR